MQKKIDAKVYREALEYYRQWNDAKLIEQAQREGQYSHREAWLRYNDLIMFGRSIAPEQHELERKKNREALIAYYRAVQILETRRSAHGRTT